MPSDMSTHPKPTHTKTQHTHGHTTQLRPQLGRTAVDQRTGRTGILDRLVGWTIRDSIQKTAQEKSREQPVPGGRRTQNGSRERLASRVCGGTLDLCRNRVKQSSVISQPLTQHASDTSPVRTNLQPTGDHLSRQNQYQAR
mgnify:CR=1 FL=1